MAAKAQSTWTFQARDGNHAVGVKVNQTFWGFVMTIEVDGVEIEEVRGGTMKKFWGNDYNFRVGQHHVGVLKVSRKGWGGTEFNLLVDGRGIPAGNHFVLESPEQPQQPQQPAQAPPIVIQQTSPAGSSGSTPVMPVLPKKCPNCQSPLSMDSVIWNGPMSANCPACGTGVEVEWRKIGA